MIRKKQTVSPPSKYVGAVSPRNAPQEAIISDTSIRAYEYMEQDVNDYANKQSAKFYSPEFRAQQNVNVQKGKSPTNSKQGQFTVNIAKQTERAKNPKLSNVQQQALFQLQKAKKNRVNTMTDQSWSKQQIITQNPAQNALNIHYGIRQPQPIVIQKTQRQNNPQSSRPKNGEIEQFQYIFSNGDKYNGIWNGKWIQGNGVYDFTKQNLQYRGQFKSSKQHGKGTLLRKPINPSLREDLIYDGQWMNGVKQGFGKYFYFKDTYYEGQWINNMKQGRGKFVSPDGEYEGQWKNNKKHGNGVLKMKNDSIFQGYWQDDKFVDGTVVYNNRDTYQGEFKNQLRDGFGVYKYSNNSTQYRGQWTNGQKNGSAAITFYNGDKYNGGMARNKKEGNMGSYEWVSGDRVKGQFIDDIPIRGKILIKNEGQFDFDLNR